VLAGLQGSGKTTTAAKLANLLRKQGRHPLLVAADVHRPAAIDQLVALGKQLGLPVRAVDPKRVATDVAALASGAAAEGHDTVIVDTAGRLHIDEAMMTEIADVVAAAKPHETLLVVDAMAGQDAVESAQEHMDEKTAEAQAKKFLEAQFTFDDFYSQLQQVKKMGPLGDLLKMIPGLGGIAKQLPEGPEAEREMRKIEAIISSMTKA